MKRDPIIFDAPTGCVFERFSYRRWCWGIALSFSFLSMSAAASIGSGLDHLGGRFCGFSYWRLDTLNPLRAPLWALGQWIQTNAWNCRWIGNHGYRLFIKAYCRSGRALLDAFNTEIGCDHLSPVRRPSSDDWNDAITFELPDLVLPPVNLNGTGKLDRMARETLLDYQAHKTLSHQNLPPGRKRALSGAQATHRLGLSGISEPSLVDAASGTPAPKLEFPAVTSNVSRRRSS